MMLILCQSEFIGLSLLPILKSNDYFRGDNDQIVSHIWSN